jgi:large-conductance mechanosensitive channel
MLNKSTGSTFIPMATFSQDAIEYNFNNSYTKKMPTESIVMPVSTKTDRTIKFEESKIIELEKTMKVYIDSTIFNYGVIIAAVLTSILINIIIIIILV